MNEDPVAMTTPQGDEFMYREMWWESIDRQMDQLEAHLDEFDRLLELAEERHRKWREEHPV